MNMHGVVSRYTRAVSPAVVGAVYVNTGYTIASNYAQAPMWTKFSPVALDVQALSSGEVRHLDSLGIQGVRRAVYLNGNVDGLDRPLGKGGDVLFFNASWWKIGEVLEPWDGDGWTKVAVVLQNGPAAGITP